MFFPLLGFHPFLIYFEGMIMSYRSKCSKAIFQSSQAEIFSNFKKRTGKNQCLKNPFVCTHFLKKKKKVKSFPTQFFLYGENIRECPMRYRAYFFPTLHTESTLKIHWFPHHTVLPRPPAAAATASGHYHRFATLF